MSLFIDPNHTEKIAFQLLTENQKSRSATSLYIHIKHTNEQFKTLSQKNEAKFNLGKQ